MQKATKYCVGVGENCTASGAKSETDLEVLGLISATKSSGGQKGAIILSPPSKIQA